ncbi:hypothetical protein [Streptomyces sp. CBMA29]|uniref:hypothetical protein n=1 Tax=Streptomyces sp. CBMA29 TaxID=1896314 RepID=UPI001661C4A4|nr:hypothetical protein [Streptomyces sp. CBMA29]MBD0736450.1 hypothetical protein [Streptomyces sp. CBMA29]
MPDSPPDTAEQPRLWQVKIALVATAAEHEHVMDKLSAVLCPDPDHEGPCPIPWAMHSVNEDSLSGRKRKALLAEIQDTNGDPAPDEEASVPDATGHS